MEFDRKKALDYICGLIIKDLANHSISDSDNLMTADQLEFSLPAEEVSFRKEVLKKIIADQNDSKSNTVFKPKFTELNWHELISQHDAEGIAFCLANGKTIEAIKRLREVTGFGLKDAKTIIDKFLPSSRNRSDINRKQASDKFLATCYGGAVNRIIQPWRT